MSLENSEKQELNTNKPNKISLSDEDKEFIQILRLVYPRVSRKTPSWVKKNVMDAYAKEYHYRILWRTIKTKIVEYKEALFGTKGGLEIALASTVVLFILSGIVYYQYTKSKNVNLSNQITKEQNKINQPQIKDVSQTIRGSFVTDARTLTSVKKIYIEILGNDETLENIQNQVIDRFSKNNIFIITEKNNADAVLRFSVILSSNELFARLVDRKNNVIWSVNKSITNKSNLGIEIVNILTEDINEAKNK